MRHNAVDGVPQRLPPHRTATLSGLGIKPSPPIPPAPAVPLEHARTVPAAPDFDRKKTVRAPTPPGVIAIARGGGPLPLPTSIVGPYAPLPVPTDTPTPRRPAPPPMPPTTNAPESSEPPPRRTRGGGSSPDLTEHRLDQLERTTDRTERAVGRLESKVGGVELGLANLTQKVEVGNARASSETIKIIVGGAVSVALAVVGARVTAPENKTTVEVHKSQAEIETELCNKKIDETERGQCLADVLKRLVEPTKR